jgi:hypothetical protein
VSAAFVLTLGGCARPQSSYTPYTAAEQGQPKVVERAVLAYEGDVPALEAVGGVLLGELTMRANGVSYAVRERALVEAADRGASHVVFGGERRTETSVELTPSRKVVSVNASAAPAGNETYISATTTTTAPPGTHIPIVRNSGTYYLVRVPIRGWCNLPAALRPTTTDDGWCEEQARTQEAERVAREALGNRQLVRIPKPMLCTTDPTDAETGLCFVEESRCKDARELVAKQGAFWSVCNQYSAVACFDYQIVMTGAAKFECSPSVKDCEARRARRAEDPDYHVEASPCGVLRFDQHADHALDDRP